MNGRRFNRGFTLLEVLVATMIMGIAVVSLLTAISTSMRNAARLTDHDRMAMLARTKLDELLVNYDLPLEGEFDGRFDGAVTGGEEAGYHVAMTVFEAPPNAAGGTPVLQRLLCHVWWKEGVGQGALDLEAFRRNVIPVKQQ